MKILKYYFLAGIAFIIFVIMVLSEKMAKVGKIIIEEKIGHQRRKP